MKCTNCGRKLDDNELFCVNCGTQSEQPHSEEKSRECAHCGSTMLDDEAYCRLCGASSGGLPEPAANVTFNNRLNCPGCGAEFTPGLKFCGSCGNPLPEVEATSPRTPKAERRTVTGSRGRKRIRLTPRGLMISAGVLAVVATLLIAVFSLSPGSTRYGTLHDNSLYHIESADANGAKRLVFLSGSGKAVCELFYENAVSIRYSLDRSVAAVFDAGGTDAYQRTYGSLSVVSLKGTLSRVSDGVYAYAVSSSGTAVAYVKDAGEDGTGKLCLYDLAGGRTKEIAENAYAEADIILSPDGMSVAYVSDYRLPDNYRSSVNVNGKTSEIGKNCFPVALTNGAKIIYYVKDETLYALRGKNNEKLGAFSVSDSFFLNRDHSQFVYNNRDGGANIAVNGRNRELLNYPFIEPLCPENTAFCSGTSGSSYGRTYDVGTFTNSVWSFGYALYYIDKKWDALKITGDFDSAFMSYDSTGIIYSASGTIYKIDLKKLADYEYKTILYEGTSVNSLATSKNLGQICFTDGIGMLYYKKGENGALKEISEGVETCFITDNGTCYFTQDSVLHSSKNGGKPKKISQIRFDTVALKPFVKGILIQGDGNDGYDVYYVKTGGSKPVLAAEGVHSVLPDAVWVKSGN